MTCDKDINKHYVLIRKTIYSLRPKIIVHRQDSHRLRKH